jgi:multisubunit Na+/H+ antiporter MnhB subunit
VEEGGAPTLALALFPLVLPFFGGALSAYLGFSSMLYGAIALVLLVLAIDEENRASAWIPALGLVVALLRPDGVAIGVGFTLLGLWHAAQTDRLVPYLAAAATAACAGVVYFAARYAYFGLLLPLPLYVKGQGAMRGPLADRIVHVLPWLRGIAGDLSWLKSAQGPAPLLCAGALLALVLPRSGRREALRMGQALIPFALFLALLALAFQHQNVHFRFQAPALLAIVFVVFRLAALALRGPRARRLGIVALLWLAIAPAVFAGGRAIVANWNCRSYIDQFPARLATILDPNRSIALTEAGRLPYWVRTRTYDIPGLNDPDTAHGPATLEYIEGIQPDIVMFNASYAYRLRPPREGPARKFVLLAASSLSRAVSPPFRRAFEDGCADGQLTSVQAAPVLLGRYLIDHQDAYALALVRYKGMGAHVYGIRKSLPEATEILRALEDSTSGRTYASYAALKHFPGARRFDAAIDAAAKPTGSPRG